MTTMTSPTVLEAHQKLIDARLNTIDRMLIDCVPRSDRLAIVHEVESQILEQLSDRDPASLSREDVLDVLRRLDPPEAYLPEESEEGYLWATPPRLSPVQPTRRAPTSNSAKAGGLIGGIAGLTAFVMIGFEFMMFFVVSSLQADESLSLLLLLTPAMFGIVSAIIGMVMGIRNRRQGAWPILGMIFSAMALPIWTLGSLYLILMFLS